MRHIRRELTIVRMFFSRRTYIPWDKRESRYFAACLKKSLGETDHFLNLHIFKQLPFDTSRLTWIVWA